MQISGVSFTLPHWLCLLRVLMGTTATGTSFPLSKHTGGVTLHQLSQACVFIYSSLGKWVFPSLLWSFPPTATFTSFSAPGCWAGAAAPVFSSRLVVRGFSSPLWHSGHRALFATCLFCCYCLLFSFFFFFSLGRGWSAKGAMLIWPRIV
jgi:hypothetical protein